MKLRIAAAAAVGVVLIGILAWPLAGQREPFQAVRVGNMTLVGCGAVLALAFIAGLAGYFVSWPYGCQIGILAVPSGLALWAGRSGSMASQIQAQPLIEQRLVLLAGLAWEPLFWLAVVAAGFAGVLAARRIRAPQKAHPAPTEVKLIPARHLNAVAALAGAVLIAQISLGKLAQDVQMTNGRLGAVVGQPAIGQVVFGVVVAFGLAAFVVKHFLGAGYIWPIIASALVGPCARLLYARRGALEHLAQSWPPAFFVNPVMAVLPVQMVAFGALGAICGYWAAIRYDFWRKHEI